MRELVSTVEPLVFVFAFIGFSGIYIFIRKIDICISIGVLYLHYVDSLVAFVLTFMLSETICAKNLRLRIMGVIINCVK